MVDVLPPVRHSGWGVPVITLTGRTYVGRMSTAVLRGAELDALCAESHRALCRPSSGSGRAAGVVTGQSQPLAEPDS